MNILNNQDKVCNLLPPEVPDSRVGIYDPDGKLVMIHNPFPSAPSVDLESVPYVYFLQASPPQGLIKIGTTKNINKRIAMLRGGSPYPLSLLAVMEGDIGVERALHDRFIDLKAHHEWFNPGPKLIQFIEEVSA